MILVVNQIMAKMYFAAIGAIGPSPSRICIFSSFVWERKFFILSENLLK